MSALDGDDVIATMATGAGKMGLLGFLMLAVRAISQDPSLALQNCTFPKDSCMLVICPTKALEEDIVRKLLLWFQIVELIGVVNSTELKHEGIWITYICYQRRHNSSSTSSQTVPAFNNHGRCVRCLSLKKWRDWRSMDLAPLERLIILYGGMPNIWIRQRLVSLS